MNEMLHDYTIRRKCQKLGRNIFGCLHKLARNALRTIAVLLQSPALNDAFLYPSVCVVRHLFWSAERSIAMLAAIADLCIKEQSANNRAV